MAVTLSPEASQGKVNAATKSFASQDPMRPELEVKSESPNSKITILHWVALLPSEARC